MRDGAPHRALLVLDDERDFSGPSIVLFRLFEALVCRGAVELRVLSQRSPAIEAALAETQFNHLFHEFPLTYSRENLPFMLRDDRMRTQKRNFIVEQARVWGASYVHMAVHPLGPLLALALTQQSIPSLVHFHANHPIPRLSPYRFPFGRCFSVPGVHALAVSDWIADNMRALGIPSSRITRLYNGLPIPEAIPASPRNDAAIGPTFAFIAQIRPEKGLEHFLMALAAFAQQRASPSPAEGPVLGLIIGRSFDQSYLEKCKSLANDLVNQLGGALAFEFTGFSSDPYTLKPYLDGVVLPSMFDDPLPTVAIESVCRGLPTIAYARGGLPEILGDGRGVLVQGGDWAGIAIELAKSFKEDAPEQRALRSRNSIKLFSIDTMVEAYLAVVDRIVYGVPAIGRAT